MRSNLKHWRESATVIALARSNAIKDVKSNYEILFQKRSAKSEFMPSTIVFPGGAIDDSDCSHNWLSYFKSFNIADHKFKEFQLPSAPISKIFEHSSDPNLRQIELRITAIRETFEELGILICKKHHDDPATSYMTEFDVKHWQKKVHKDPQEFLSLCQSLKCYPDIWSLYLWSNWLTPIKKVASHRFDAVFFLTFFDKKPPVNIDGKEVSEFRWSTPEKILESFKAKELVLPTPQWYELTRLAGLTDMDQLKTFAATRSRYGCELFFPIYQDAKDGIVVILPGDSYYPKNPDFYQKMELFSDQTTLQELRDTSESMHRIIYHDPHTISLDLKNYTPTHCHLSPKPEILPMLNHKL